MLNVISLVLTYLVFATIFHDTKMVGEFTMSLGTNHIALFGYMAYLDVFLLAYLIYAYIKKIVDFDAILGWTLLFLSLTLLQALIFDLKDVGIIAGIIYSIMAPTVGKIGYGAFVFFSLTISILLLTEEENHFVKLYEEIKEVINLNQERTFCKEQEDLFSKQSSSTSKRKRAIDNLDIENYYTPPKAKTKLEREREKLRKVATQAFS
jgi:S-DNA-T family DNA segregation ATPase FtsK/SpoIIIE